MNSTRSNRSKDRQAAARRKTQQRLRFETLEDRRLLAVDLQLLKDINTLPETVGSIPAAIVHVGTTIFFTAETSTQGRELWKTDGTANGTVLVKDINLGKGSSNPRHLTNVNGTLYFQANDGTSGVELWRSDGTQAGTVRVKDINADGAFGSDPRDFTNVNGVLFFRANDGTSGFELWKSNGTELGTVRVKDIRPGSSGSLGQIAYSLTNVDGILFFEANDGTTGNELWKSNGTEIGTVRVKDISPGNSNPGGLTNVNGTLFFQANDGTSGVELWRSDGSAGGTVRVMDINNGSGSSAPSEFTNVNGTLFFRANGGLWKSNGIESGTEPVGTVIGPRGLVNVSGTLFFRGFGAGGYELWKSNGSDAGTVLVKDISGTSNSNPGILTNVNGTLFFTADDGVFGVELWKSDGTDLGTVTVKEINSNAFQGAYPVALTNVNGTLFFSANDGTGTELWRSNGTNIGTARVKDIKTTNRDSAPTDFVNVNGTVFFVANDGTSGRELWKTDGTQNGTVRVKDIRPGSIGSNIFGSDPKFLTNVNGTLFFAANDGTSGLELWKSDGTEIGTVRVKDIRPGNKYSDSLSIFNSEFVNLNGTLFFIADDGTTGNELWKSDGTEQGTVRVKDIQLGSNSSRLSELTNVNGKLFFSANDGTNGFELWMSNGTDATTVRVKDIRSGTVSSNPSYLTNVNNTLFFVANDGTTGNELWRSDGTDIGTTLVKDIIPGVPGAVVSPRFLTNVNGTLFFRADRDFFDSELWKSDGTTLGTVQVKDIRLGSESSYPRNFVNVNGTLFFVADDGSTGEELWRSDGTTNGTFRLKDIRPGVLSPNPSYLTVVNGALFFQANDGIHGQEMWQSDGTVNGTLLASDLVLGSGGGNPRSFIGINNKILVAAGTEENGTELFIGELTTTGGSTSLSIAATSANKAEGNTGGTTAFTFTVTRSGALTGATSVNYAVTGVGARPAAASDFVGNALPNSMLTFAAGQATRVISIPVQGDTTFETSENFRLTLSSPSGGATITTATAAGLILNDDTALAIATTSADKSEGNTGTTAFTFTVTRSGVLTGATTVNYAVTGIGANPATAIDFVGSVFPSGVVTFAAGQATRVITIPIRGDTTLEADENFRVTISGASGGATITTAAALGLIRNDETSLAIAATNASKNEGNAGTTVFSFTVTRSGLLTSATTVNYAVTGLGTNPTTAADFVGNILPTGVVTFAVGQATRVVSIFVRGDTIVEANENFRVTLSSPSGGATLAVASAVGLIRNDDSSLAIAPLSADKNEGLSGVTLFTFTVTRSGSLTEVSTVNYAVTGLGVNPATAADFSGNVLPSGTVTFAAGEATKVISIVVRGDATVEANEGFRVTLFGASLGTSLTTALASGLIRNDDV